MGSEGELLIIRVGVKRGAFKVAFAQQSLKGGRGYDGGGNLRCVTAENGMVTQLVGGRHTQNSNAKGGVGLAIVSSVQPNLAGVAGSEFAMSKQEMAKGSGGGLGAIVKVTTRLEVQPNSRVQGGSTGKFANGFVGARGMRDGGGAGALVGH